MQSDDEIVINIFHDICAGNLDAGWVAKFDFDVRRAGEWGQAGMEACAITAFPWFDVQISKANLLRWNSIWMGVQGVVASHLDDFSGFHVEAFLDRLAHRESFSW